MTLGQAIIDELRRRGAMGLYFKFADYQQLKRIDDAEELKRFFNLRGLTLPCDCSDPSAVVDGMCSTSALQAREAVGCWIVSEVVYWLLYLLSICGH